MGELEREKVLDGGPEWRWRLVRSLVERNRKPSPRFVDPLIADGYRYLKRRSALQEPEDQLWLRNDFPDLYDAHVMYENTDSERWIVEAGILADQPDEFLAEYISSRAPVIRTYTDYFFDIRGKLGATGYVINRLFRPALLRGATVHDHDMLLKMAAWAGGWRLVQELLDFRQLSPEGLNWLKTSFIHGLVKKGWLAVLQLDVNNFTAPELINSVLRMAELEHTAAEAKLKHVSEGTKESEIVEGLKSLLNSVQTGILRPAQVVGDEERALPLLEANHGKDG